MLIPSLSQNSTDADASLSRRVNANSQRLSVKDLQEFKLIKKGEC